jgi:hypothetical protein
MSTSSPTHPHKGLRKGLCDTLSSSFVNILKALGGCGSRLLEYVFVTLGLYKSCLWLLNYALRTFGLCS